MIDCHTHVMSIGEANNVPEIVSKAGFHRAPSIIDEKRVNYNLDVLFLKALHPEIFYAFGSIDYSFIFMSLFSRFKIRLIGFDIGFDGIKMVEGKPTYRKLLKTGFDESFCEDYFERVKETNLPLLFQLRILMGFRVGLRHKAGFTTKRTHRRNSFTGKWRRFYPVILL